MVKRAANDDNLLGPPPPKRSRPITVLDDDTFVDTVTEIIRRDFFPGLALSEAKQEYLDALETGDEQWIQEVAQKASGGASSHRGEINGPYARAGLSEQTPANGSSCVKQKPGAGRTHASDHTHYNKDLPLDTFLARYTSEDNESFNALLHRLNQRRRARYAWFRNVNGTTAKGGYIDGQAYKSQPSVQLSNPGRGQQHPLISSAQLESARNALMFLPEDQSRISPRSGGLRTRSSQAPKDIAIKNTRFTTRPPDSNSGPGEGTVSSTLSAVRAAVRGISPDDADSPILRGSQSSTRVGGWTYVTEDDPVSNPGFAAQLRQDYNNVFSEQDRHRTPFRIQASSAREELHHRLVDKSRRARIGTAAEQMITRGIGYKPDGDGIGISPSLAKSGSLTPAGRRLLESFRSPVRSESFKK